MCALSRQLGSLLIFYAVIGAQPERNNGWLHSLLNHTYEVGTQSVQVSLLAQLGREGFQRLSSVILPPVEKPIYERLDNLPERGEQRSYHESGHYYGELRLLLLTDERSPHRLRYCHAAEIDCHQHRGEDSVDEGAVY